MPTQKKRKASKCVKLRHTLLVTSFGVGYSYYTGRCLKGTKWHWTRVVRFLLLIEVSKKAWRSIPEHTKAFEIYSKDRGQVTLERGKKNFTRVFRMCFFMCLVQRPSCTTRTEHESRNVTQCRCSTGVTEGNEAKKYGALLLLFIFFLTISLSIAVRRFKDNPCHTFTKKPMHWEAIALFMMTMPIFSS